jgi:hypothetical protein
MSPDLALFGTNTMSDLSLECAAKRTFVSHSDHADAARSSLSVPRATIIGSVSGNGRCNAFASSQGARIHTSRSSSVVRRTGIAFGWIGSTTAFGAVVKKP